MSRLARFGVPVTVLLLGGAPLGAQRSLAVSLEARVGMVSPDSYLYEQYTNFSGDGPVEWTDGSLGRGLMVGVGFEVGRPGGSVQLRGEVLRSFDTWLAVSRSIVQPRVLFDPPYVETTWLDVPAAVTLTTLEVVVPTRVTVWRLQPYVLVGVGGKRYDFGDPTAPNDVEAILPAGGFTWGGEVGAGFTLRLRGLTLDLQGRDAVTRYWGKMEHDVLFSAGVLRRVH